MEEREEIGLVKRFIKRNVRDKIYIKLLMGEIVGVKYEVLELWYILIRDVSKSGGEY